MTEIVLNEKQWVEEAIEKSSLGDKPSETLRRLAVYYSELGYKRSEIEKRLEDFIIRCDPTSNIVRWQKYIDSSLKYAKKARLIVIDPIAITKSELESISLLPGVLLQRIMFTLLCLAKYGNAVNPKNNAWVNRDIRDIFALANVKVTVRKQALLFNDLWHLGYVGYSSIVDNINVNVKIIDESDAAIELRIDDFRNLGNQYMLYLGGDYFACQNCGIIVKRNSPNQKYCKECSVDINIRKTSENRLQRIA